ncbi:MAG TPA: hypothetical protein VMM15_32875 [Bradyrhizobium sp.]|nr:hypothetical protein [Bradyrhizobium sp.]
MTPSRSKNARPLGVIRSARHAEIDVFRPAPFKSGIGDLAGPSADPDQPLPHQRIAEPGHDDGEASAPVSISAWRQFERDDPSLC